jgi:hypothetical protein
MMAYKKQQKQNIWFNVTIVVRNLFKKIASKINSIGIGRDC